MSGNVPPPPMPAPPPGPGYGQVPAKGYAPNGQEYAPWILRVGSYIIDYIIPGLIMIPGYLLGFKPASIDNAGCVSYDDAGNCLVFGATTSGASLTIWYWLFLLLAIAFQLWNIGYRQSKTGKSIGKSVFKLTAVDANTGQYKGFWWLILRQILLGIDFMICYVGVLWPLWDDKRQCLISDKASSTVVLKDA